MCGKPEINRRMRYLGVGALGMHPEWCRIGKYLSNRRPLIVNNYVNH